MCQSSTPPPPGSYSSLKSLSPGWLWMPHFTLTQVFLSPTLLHRVVGWSTATNAVKRPMILRWKISEFLGMSGNWESHWVFFFGLSRPKKKTCPVIDSESQNLVYFLKDGIFVVIETWYYISSMFWVVSIYAWHSDTQVLDRVKLDTSICIASRLLISHLICSTQAFV